MVLQLLDAAVMGAVNATQRTRGRAQRGVAVNVVAPGNRPAAQTARWRRRACVCTAKRTFACVCCWQIASLRLEAQL